MEVAYLSSKHPASNPDGLATLCLQTSRKKQRLGSVETPFPFTFEDLQRCLYKQANIRLLKNEDAKKPLPSESQKGEQCFWCDISRAENIDCPLHKNGSTNGAKIAEPPTSIRSLPDEVQLCLSGIPGAGYGICAKRLIPIGAWIGPYEGKLLKPMEVTPKTDTSYMWEIYNEGNLCGYIDGNDENSSSWMRYIRCARHQREQNLFAFQYMGKIYYRAFREIAPGGEMLVWYDEKYPQYLGIPSNVFDMAAFIPSGIGAAPGNGTAVAFQGNDCTPQTPTSPHSSLPSPSASSLSPTTPNEHQPVNTFPESHSSTHERKQHGFPTPLSPVTSENSPPSSQKTDNGSDSEPLSPDSNTRSITELSEVSLWKCGQCKKSFPQRAMLQVHVCMEYPRKPFQCGHCSQSFANPNGLRTHAVIHVGKKPFRCGYCSRSFAGATTLNNHIRTHTGERPFICEACGKHFTQGSQLSRHQRIPGDCVARA